MVEPSAVITHFTKDEDPRSRLPALCRAVAIVMQRKGNLLGVWPNRCVLVFENQPETDL